MRQAANRNHNHTGGTHRCRLRGSLSAERTRTLRHHLTQLDASPRPPGRTVPWTAPSTPLTACGPPDQRAPFHRGPAACPVSCLRKRHRSVGPTAARRQVSRLSGSRSPYLDPGGRPQGRNVAVSPSPSTSRPGLYMPLGATDIVMQGTNILPPPPPPQCFQPQGLGWAEEQLSHLSSPNMQESGPTTDLGNTLPTPPRRNLPRTP